MGAVETKGEAGRVRRSRRDAIDNESRVREAAMLVFEQRGNAMTMDDVAAEAGVSKGTVYNTFGTRQDLVDEMTVEFLGRATDSYRQELDSESVWDALLDVILTPTFGVAARPEILDPKAPAGRVKDALTVALTAFGELVERGKSEGVIRPEITVDHLLVLFRGLAMALPEYSLGRATQAKEYAVIILRGIHA
ncbi:TetR/AcrR family transcriptional regulator [Streptomyces sp. NPDC006602]|uniref:TetR/AcrR family transcriptional regulator n=1 Tax=Streptomyces sp. NPDC006602 TaxID=3364751 RepID=UPI0036BDC01E